MRVHLSRFLQSVLYLLASTCHAVPLDVSVDAQSAILIDSKEDIILFEKNADVRRHPASTIKVLSALYVLSREGLNLDRKVTVSFEAVRSISEQAKEKGEYRMPAYWLESAVTKVLGLKVGERVTMRDLFYAHLIASCGDASNVLLQSVHPRISDGVVALNAYTKSLGCRDTRVMNPHGLPHPKQYTTARDLSRIVKAAFENPVFSEIVATPVYTCSETNKRPQVELRNTNRLIRRGRYFYEKALGGKTGYHSRAGRCLVAKAENQERSLIAVVLKNSSREQSFRDCKCLFEAAFREKPMIRRVFPKGLQSFKRLSDKVLRPVPLLLKKGLEVKVYPSERSRLSAEVRWLPLEGAVREGELMGTVVVKDQYQRILGSGDLYAEKTVGMSPLLWMEKNISLLMAIACAGLLFAYRRAS